MITEHSKRFLIHDLLYFSGRVRGTSTYSSYYCNKILYSFILNKFEQFQHVKASLSLTKLKRQERLHLRLLQWGERAGLTGNSTVLPPRTEDCLRNVVLEWEP